MTAFGEALRSFWEMTRDPGRHQRTLSQARLGELIGHEMEERGVAGAAVSERERGKSKVSAETCPAHAEGLRSDFFFPKGHAMDRGLVADGSVPALAVCD